MAKVYDRPENATQSSGASKMMIVGIIATLAILVTIFIVAQLLSRQNPQDVGARETWLPKSERVNDARPV
jgi:hypothetical protein